MKSLCFWWFCRRREKELRFREGERESSFSKPNDGFLVLLTREVQLKI